MHQLPLQWHKLLTSATTFSAVCHPHHLSYSTSAPAVTITLSSNAVRPFPGAPLPQLRPPWFACLAPMPESCASNGCADHPSARPAAALLALVTCRSVRRCAQPSSTGAAHLRTVPGSLARSPPTFPPTSAAWAGPQPGLMRLTQGAVVREFSRTTPTSSWSTIILNVGNLLTASERSVAAARSLPPFCALIPLTYAPPF